VIKIRIFVLVKIAWEARWGWGRNQTINTLPRVARNDILFGERACKKHESRSNRMRKAQYERAKNPLSAKIPLEHE